MKKKFNNILIIGGMGFIGSYVLKNIIKKKITKKIIVLDNFSSNIDPLNLGFNDFRKKRFEEFMDLNEFVQSKSKHVNIERVNVENYLATFKVIRQYDPEIIIHLAALPLAKVKNISCEEFKKGSVDTTSNIIESINQCQQEGRLKNFKRFIYVSSSMVYGDFVKNSAKETDNTNPKEPYGIMKLAGEVITKGLCKFFKIPYTIIRPSAVYGPTDMNQRVSQYFILKALNNETIEVHGKNEKLDFTYVEDIAEGIIKSFLTDKGANETFNITFGKSRKILDYVKILQKYFKDITIKIKKRDSFRPKRGTLDISKARKLLNFKPKYDLEKGIKEYIKFYKDK